MYKKKYAKYLLKINSITGGTNFKYRHDPYSELGRFIYNNEQNQDTTPAAPPAPAPAAPAAPAPAAPAAPAAAAAAAAAAPAPWRSHRFAAITPAPAPQRSHRVAAITPALSEQFPPLEIYFCYLSNIKLNMGVNSEVKLLFCTNFPYYHITYYIKCNQSRMDGYHVTKNETLRYGNVDGRFSIVGDPLMEYIYNQATNNDNFNYIVNVAREICRLAGELFRTNPESLSNSQILKIINREKTTENTNLNQLAELIKELNSRATYNMANGKCRCLTR
jgi:hypothetical protein